MSEKLNKKLFSVSIPTYNRAGYLKQNLLQLKKEMTPDLIDFVEVLVSDNCSTDNTEQVVNELIADGMEITYIRNSENLGWGRNFLQCFEKSTGKYVLLLGDDDLLYDGALKIIIDRLKHSDLGVLYLRPYGYSDDFKKEFPGKFGKSSTIYDANEYLLTLGPNTTLISCCIINKELIKGEDYQNRPPGNFAHMFLIIPAALRAKENAIINKYLIACKRNNSSNYEFSEVFVKEVWELFGSYESQGFKAKSLKKLMSNLLLTYYPYYFLMQRLEKTENYKTSLLHSEHTFKGQFYYTYWNKPILTLPKPLAILWGVFTTFVGRTINGEFLIGMVFLWNRIFKKK